MYVYLRISNLKWQWTDHMGWGNKGSKNKDTSKLKLAKDHWFS